MKKTLRPIAIYLPQFHPVPENDKWWGKGFTEWTNVAKAKPRFKGHYQPHLPADLGFYDLRLEEIRQEQADMAKEAGIHGFCYYHYWFNGKRILEKPFQEVFESGSPEFPFMLCWANENWTRAWDGGENEILLKQNYSEEDDYNHITSLIPYFKDPRYIKVDGKPVFAVYKSDLMPDPEKTIKIWRNVARENGIELYILRFERWNNNTGKAFLKPGFDAAVDFQPLSPYLKSYIQWNFAKISTNIGARAAWHFKNFFKRNPLKDRIIDLEKYVNFQIDQSNPNYKQYPGVSPSWDNSARRKKEALIFINSSPQLYKKWLKSQIGKFVPFSTNENFIFINAWNEWAEGNHLEPCVKYGSDYLIATKEALEEQ